MSMRVIGFRPADDRYRQMKAVLDACRQAKIEPPAAVKEFFPRWTEDEAMPDHGVTVALGADWLKQGDLAAGVTHWKSDMEDGFEVDLRAIDPTIKVLRFYNSY